MAYSNPEYFAYAKKMEPRIKKKLSHEFEQIHTTGIESVKALPENASILYTPLHKSHMDYIMLLANTFSHDLPFPRVVSGNNLLSGFTSAFIKHVARLDFAALGTISIPRARPKPPQRGAYDEFDQFRKAEQEYADSLSAHENETTEFQTSFTSGLENEVIALFPEARERETHNQKTGRTYTGLERNFSPLFAREAVKHENLYIVPLAITYDWVPETHLFHKLNIAKSRGNSRAYQKLEAQTFLRTLWKGGKGDVYVNYGEPIKASDVSSSQLCRTAQESAYNLVHPTDIMIASHVARSQYTAEGEINLGTIPVWGVELEHELARKGLRDQQDVYDRRESYKKVRDFLTSEKVLRPDKNGKMDILKPEVINYYANQIDHFLK